MDTQGLNLARKWRSKNFDQIIGQDLSVRMLKNSLYLNQYFPVYLFSGQRGCGKTSTARVFAAAINCKELSHFQKNPKEILLPCLACESCLALIAGRHPDFIEIDAASNTGVDNVRNIIDSSALLPLMGSKKIYLIDEAHMMSRAAFNAFLKLLEEPPTSVIFILATTDAQKIIDTVRSRCFQLVFKPVSGNILLQHLTTICQKEQIVYDADALQLIINETQGSIRDAINLLEQVRFSDIRVSKNAVYEVLGYLDDDRLLQLVKIIFTQRPAALLKFFQEHTLERFSAEFLWSRCIELLRACVWIKHGIVPNHFNHYTNQIHALVEHKSISYLTGLLELFYRNEWLFKKTTAQTAFLEMLLLKVCKKNESNSNSNAPAIATAGHEGVFDEFLDDSSDNDWEDDSESEIIIEDSQKNSTVKWQQFLSKIETLQDPLIESIFKQADFSDDKDNELTINFPKELTFFHEILESTQKQWQPLLEILYGKNIQVQITYKKEKIQANSQQPKVAKSVMPVVENKDTAKQNISYKKNFNNYNKKIVALTQHKIDVSNVKAWPQANLLLSYFPGTITQLGEQK